MEIRAIFASRRRKAPPSLALALLFLPSAGLLAQVNVALPSVTRENVDSEERISGNAATGLIVLDDLREPERHNLWGWFRQAPTSFVDLQISSVDGRYVAQVEYQADELGAGWNALRLELEQFDFLSNYSLDQISVLLLERDSALTHLATWGPSHIGLEDREVIEAEHLPLPLRAETSLRAYMNTERSTAFVVEYDSEPRVCEGVPGDSGFKFNAVCEFSLGGISDGQPVEGKGHASAFDVRRRAGTRALSSIKVVLDIEYDAVGN